MADPDTDGSIDDGLIFGTFVAALADQLPAQAEAVQRELEGMADPPNSERELAIRCLAAGVDAWRDSIGAPRRKSRIESGEEAFREWEALQPVRADTPHEAIQTTLSEALLVASDSLGPFRGGEPASFKHPTEVPAMVVEVEPSRADLRRIASLSGQSVGLTARLGSADPLAAVRAIGR